MNPSKLVRYRDHLVSRFIDEKKTDWILSIRHQKGISKWIVTRRLVSLGFFLSLMSFFSRALLKFKPQLSFKGCEHVKSDWNGLSRVLLNLGMANRIKSNVARPVAEPCDRL